jgi:hypothetical protein
MNGATDGHGHPDSTKSACRSDTAIRLAARRGAAGRDPQTRPGGERPHDLRIRRLAGGQRTLCRSVRSWRAPQVPSCSWFACFRRSHSPGSRSTHERPGSPTAITGSSYGRMRRPCSVNRERRCHPTSLSRVARSSARPLYMGCVSWPSPRPRTCSCSVQRTEGPLGRLLHRSLARGLLRDPPSAVTVVSRDPRDRPRSVPGQPERLARGRRSAGGTLARFTRDRKEGI